MGRGEFLKGKWIGVGGTSHACENLGSFFNIWLVYDAPYSSLCLAWWLLWPNPLTYPSCSNPSLWSCLLEFTDLRLYPTGPFANFLQTPSSNQSPPFRVPGAVFPRHS